MLCLIQESLFECVEVAQHQRCEDGVGSLYHGEWHLCVSVARSLAIGSV